MSAWTKFRNAVETVVAGPVVAKSGARLLDVAALGPLSLNKTTLEIGRYSAAAFLGGWAASALGAGAGVGEAAAGSSTGAGVEAGAVSAGAAPAAGADLATGGLIVTPEEAATSGAIFSTAAPAAGSGVTFADVLATGKAASTVLGGIATVEGLLAPKPNARPTVVGAAQPYTGITIFPPDAGLYNQGGSPFGSGTDQTPANFTSSATMIGLGILVALLLAAFFKR